MDKISGMKNPKGKHIKAPVRAKRDGVKLGIMIVCLLMMFVVPACITMYHGAIPDTAYVSTPPQNAGGAAAHASEQSGASSEQSVSEQSGASSEQSVSEQSASLPEQSVSEQSGASPGHAQLPAASAGSSHEQSGGRTGGAAGTAADSTGGIADDDADGTAGDGPDVAMAGGAGASAAGISNGENDAASGAAAPEPSKVAYITIDDGPTRDITPGMLDVLKEQGVPATFFVLPKNDVDDLYMRIIDEGHEIGNHSYSHIYSRLYQPGRLEVFKDDVLQAYEFMLTNFGYETTSFRFPGGSMGRSASIIGPRQALLDELGYRYFNWHIDSGDARSDIPDRSAAALTRNVLENTRGRDRIIILMHDSGGKASTLAALPRIIEGLREQGYTFDVLRNYPQE